MHVRNLLRGQRLLSRVVVSSALLGSVFVGGLAGTASAVINPATKLAITVGYSTTVASGANLATPFQVTIEDSSAVLVNTDTSTVTATIAVAGVTVSNGVVAAVGGKADFPNLHINAPVGTYTVNFTDGTLTPISSTPITVTIGTPSQLLITTQPSAGAVTGVALARQPVVKVTDSGGNVITAATGTVTAAISTGVGVITAGSTATITSGVATFSGLTLTGVSGTFNTLSFSGPQPTVVSNGITMSGVATHLVITTQPSPTAGTGIALAQQPVVKVEDAAGNVVVADSSVMVAIASPSGALTLTNGAVNVVNGVASYVGLAINAPIGSYTLTFANGTFSSVPSAAIAITAGVPSKLIVTTEPSSFIASGVALAQQPVVKVEDVAGNVVTTVATGSATATIFSGIGGAVSAGATANFVAGVATFSGLTLTGVVASTYKLTFTGATFSVNDATSIVVGAVQAALSVNSTTAVWGRSLALTSTGGSGTGALTYAAGNGTATGCAVVGATLTFSSVGTCIVSASKAADTTYTATTSTPATVTIAKLPIPGTVRISFAKNSSALSGAAQASLLKLAAKLTPKSHLTVTGYAKGNLGLAQRRATVVVKFIQSRTHSSLGRVYSTVKNLNAADLKTLSQ